jgi:hypothetical protein
LLFSTAEVPLIAEALPMLFDLRRDMDAVVKDTPPGRDDEDDENDEDDIPLPPTPAVIRIAAYASIVLIDKYIDLMKESKLYLFVMSNVANFSTFTHS